MEQSFSEWLIYELNAREMSQADLARKAGLSRTAISDVISEKYGPGPAICLGVAKAFGLSPESVFRKAGILPGEHLASDPADLEDFREILRHLNPEEIEELKRIGWLKIDLKRQAELRKKGKG